MRLSVVIPTWCERDAIEGAVACAAAVGDEVVVADAASPDGTATAAEAAGARVVVAPRGRGAQLRAGAAAATGDVLLFLHADARLAPGARAAVERALADEAVVGGNFLLRFEPPGAAAALFSVANDLRRRLLGIYYGDSAIFVRRVVYERLGGFDDAPLFEDYALVRRLEREGRTTYVRDVTVRASARRFARAPVRTLAVWTALQVAYSAGAPPARLARWYADVRGPLGL